MKANKQTHKSKKNWIRPSVEMQIDRNENDGKLFGWRRVLLVSAHIGAARTSIRYPELVITRRSDLVVRSWMDCFLHWRDLKCIFISGVSWLRLAAHVWTDLFQQTFIPDQIRDKRWIEIAKAVCSRLTQIWRQMPFEWRVSIRWKNSTTHSISLRIHQCFFFFFSFFCVELTVRW